jgi:hypothetical protein
MGERKAFNWRRDVGNIDPARVRELARESDKSLEEFAREFIKSWPLAGEPTDQQVRGMVEEIRRRGDGR